MIASDIPESYRTPAAMARALSSYIADPRRVQSIVREHFPHSGPDTATIRKMREKHLAARIPQDAVVDGRWSAQAESDKLAAVNERFVAAIMAERRAA